MFDERIFERKKLYLVLIFAMLVVFLCVALGSNAVGVKGDNTSDDNKSRLALDLIGEDAGYASVLYNNANGLPTSESNAIAMTSEGFIWIGCYSGLIRYDGNSFERIDSTKGITSVVRLYVDSKDRLWIGTNDNGVAVKVNEDYVHFNLNEGLKSASIRSITEDDEGNIYIGTTQGVAYVDSDMKLHQVSESKIDNVYVRQLVKGEENTIYGLSMDGSFFEMKDGELTWYYTADELGIEDIRTVLPDRDKPGNFYFGTKQSKIYNKGLAMTTDGPAEIDVAPLQSINDMQFFDDQIWVCADNGIGIIKDGSFKKIENIPLDNSIEAMMMDYQGNMWFTSSRQGVMKIVPSRFFDLFEQYKLADEVVNSTCMYKDCLYVGKDRGLTVLSKDEVVKSVPVTGAVSASGKNMDITDLIEDLKDVKIRSVIRDSKDNIWISTFSDFGLIKFDGSKVLCFTQEDGLPSERVRMVYERLDGSIVVACTGGVVVIEGDTITKVYDEEFGINNTEVLTVTQADNGDILLGTDGDGIYVISGDNLTHINYEDGLSSGIVMRIKKDRKRDLFWIVTSNSIDYMNEDYEITTVSEFPYANNFDLYENGKDQMWVLSSSGIYVLPVSELLKNKEIEPVFYNRSNGLLDIATANSYSELTDDGNLYIAGKAGVVKVNIDEEFDNVNNIKVAVPYIEADGQRIYPDDDGTFKVTAKVDKITIHSFMFTYSLTDPEVVYYLDGFDKTKNTIKRSELVPIDYTNLNGGEYSFVIQLKDINGITGNEFRINIVKEKKIHEYLWFNILIIIVSAAILIGIVLFIEQRKVRKIQKKQEEQRILIEEITEAFAKVIDMKDAYTNGHSFRVADYTVKLAKELGYNEEEVEKYHNIALLHDIGKIGIPAEVLNKQGKLSDEEFAKIKSHTSLGHNVLKDISIMPELAIGARYHHERPDGRGYPDGIKGDEIPFVARIIAVADTFDAMYSTRSYRKRMNFEKVVSIIKEAAGTQLDKDVVDAFLRLVDKGEFRAPDDDGGGTTENIENIK